MKHGASPNQGLGNPNEERRENTGDEISANATILDIIQNKTPIESIFSLNLDTLRNLIITHNNINANGLWHLLAFGINSQTNPNTQTETFNTIWQKWGNHITLDDLRTKALEGPAKGKSVIWLAVFAAANGHPEVFNALWQKWGNHLTLDDLRTKALEGPNKGIPVIWILTNAKSLVVNTLLGQMPYIFNQEDLLHKPDNKNNIQQLIYTWPNSANIMQLINARNDFFAELDNVKKENKDDFNQLYLLAQIALNAGYYNASYDIGQVFAAKGNTEQAMQAYALVPQESCHVEFLNGQLTQYKKYLKLQEQYKKLENENNLLKKELAEEKNKRMINPDEFLTQMKSLIMSQSPQTQQQPENSSTSSVREERRFNKST